MKHKRFIIKIVCFIIAAALVWGVVNGILNPKYMYDNTWPTTQTYTDFYELEEDSVDVLFFGSSYCVSAFSPLELYETYGISSYNLACEQQNMLISYYWLKEALRYQSPEVVVLETYILFNYNSQEPLNSSESKQRKAIDYMKWSSVKCEAISAICENDESQSKLSYYLTNIRFHSRWTELNEDDFTYSSTSEHKGLMGYSAINGISGDTDYKPFQDGSSTSMQQPDELMKEYLDKIVELCNENEIELILVETPSTRVDIGRYNYLNQYAAENNIQYIDYNEESVYTEISYNYATDNYETGHLNIWGAKKVTDYIGEVLTEQYMVDTGESTDHESLLEYYNEVKKDCELSMVTDFSEYLDMINDSRYAIFISIKDEGTLALNDELNEKLTALGTTVDFENKYQYSYYAVINGDNSDEMIGNEELYSNGTLRDGVTTYEISSAGKECGNSSSIIIDGTEYSLNQSGMNIVVYCLDTKKVIDTVCFDTGDDLGTVR